MASIWSDSPVDWVFDGLDGIGGCLGAALFLVGAVFLVFRVLHLLLMAQFSELRHLLLGLVTDVDGLFLITLAVGVAVLAIRGKRRRRALDAHERAAGRAGGAGEAR